MNKLDLATWYAEHSGQVLIVFAIPVAIAWFYYFESAEQQEPIWIIIGTVAGAYYWSKRHLKQYCYKKVSKYAEKFSKTPKFSSSTSEELIDTLDMDILVKLDEMEEEKGEYLKLISALDIVDSEEALERLGKLKSMSYVHATSRKISLTSSGVDLLNAPLIQRTLLPPKFSTIFAKAKIWYDEETHQIGKRGKLARVIYMTNLGTIPSESFISVTITSPAERKGQIVGKIDENFLERMKRGDVFVLGGEKYQFLYSRGMKAFVKTDISKSPTIPSWFSEMLPLSFDVCDCLSARLTRLITSSTSKGLDNKGPPG
ncbi:MAG: hypothetical protein IIC67_06670 [Thaumarchaeota archaeon]|nr:hypothetical protein [Nitrososphaerota archaeon]